MKCEKARVEGEAGGRVNLRQLLCDGSDHREEAIAGMCDQRHLPGVCQERGMQPWVCARVKRGEFSEKTPGGGGDDSMKASSTCFLGRGEAADGLKGYLFVNGVEGSDEERGQSAESCQVQCRLKRRKLPVMLVTGRRGREERSRVVSWLR